MITLRILDNALVQAGFFAIAIAGIACWFQARRFDLLLSVAASLATLSIVSLVVFWASWLFFPLVEAGSAIRIAGFAAIVAFAAVGFRQQRPDTELLAVLALLFVASVALTVWTDFYGGGRDALVVPTNRWTHTLPSDSRIPFVFAQGFEQGKIARPIVGPYWLSSDRPPLQTALFLITPGFLKHGATTQGYQAASVSMQMFSLLGVWALSRSLGMSLALSLGAMAAAFFTPLLIINGSFVWPKLLAASFALFLIAIYFRRDPREHDETTMIIAGALAALAMLSHGSSIFILAGMALTTLAVRKLPRPAPIIAAIVAAGVLYAPWPAYQKFVEPPGNRSATWILAGDPEANSEGTLAATLSRYGALTSDQIWRNKKGNAYFVTSYSFATFGDTVEAVRLAINGDWDNSSKTMFGVRKPHQFFYFVHSAGILGFSLFLLPLMIYVPATRDIGIVCALTLVFWCLVAFGGPKASTVVHHGSYAPQLMLIVAALSLLSRVSIPLAFSIVSLQVLLTLVQYAL